MCSRIARSLLQGEPLPERATGAALFADLSGFTPITNALTQALGARHGAETLTARATSPISP